MNKRLSRAEICRAHAIKCRLQGQQAEREDMRQEFLELGHQWEMMAHEIEHLEYLRATFSATTAPEVLAGRASD
jgi:hypothetical protein